MNKRTHIRTFTASANCRHNPRVVTPPLTSSEHQHLVQSLIQLYKGCCIVWDLFGCTCNQLLKVLSGRGESTKVEVAMQATGDVSTANMADPRPWRSPERMKVADIRSIVLAAVSLVIVEHSAATRGPATASPTETVKRLVRLGSVGRHTGRRG